MRIHARLCMTLRTARRRGPSVRFPGAAPPSNPEAPSPRIERPGRRGAQARTGDGRVCPRP